MFFQSIFESLPNLKLYFFCGSVCDLEYNERAPPTLNGISDFKMFQFTGERPG